MRYIATFVPQQEINETCYEVDLPLPKTWDVTAFLATLSDADRAGALRTGGGDYEADQLKDDPNAPTWVQEWDGPFEVYVAGSEAVTVPEYLAAFPDTPRHMVHVPGARPSDLDAGMVRAHKDFGCHYPGGYLHWVLVDIRLYSSSIREGWLKTHEHTPFRVYVQDSDDWNAERSFATEEEAREAVALLSTGVVGPAEILALEFRSL